METAVLSILPLSGKALWSLKGKYDQHSEFKNEMKELQLFIQDSKGHIPAMEKRFRQGVGSASEILVLNRLQQDLV